MAETDKKVTNLRLDQDLYARLKDYADATERSVNSAAVFAIKTHLDQVEAKNKENH